MKLQGQVEIEQRGELLELRAFVAELLESGSLRLEQVDALQPGRVVGYVCPCGAMASTEDRLVHQNPCWRERARKALEGRP